MSMTGFGRASKDSSLGRVMIEIQSLNRKHFELQIYLPKELSRFEYEMRKWISDRVVRGFITVRVQWVPSQEKMSQFLPDPELLQNLKEKWESLAGSLGFEKKTIDLSFLLQYMPSMSSVDALQEQDEKELRLCVDAAMDRLIQMRQNEGKVLQKDLEGRLKTMESQVKSIEDLSVSSMERARQKLQEKIKALISDTDERWMREIALLVEKMDITEEITRLGSHFSQFRETLQGSQKAVGRKMDFLVQEMGREINTIGSKSMDVEISRWVVAMKSELEKVREQIQNIE